ncbi:MAG: hypothetical protein AB1498_05225 [bacterium]
MKINNLFQKIICINIFILAIISAGCSIKNKSIEAPKQSEKSSMIAIEGKIVTLDRQNYLKNAYLYVYKDASTDFKDSPFLISNPTNENGEYSITLPEGRYYFVARKFLGDEPKTTNLEMQPEEYYAYYGGNPVNIFYTSDKPVFIGFNCSKIIKKETIEPSAAGKGIKGIVTYYGKPLIDSYVIVYQNSGADFRGQVYRRSLPTDTNGYFEINLTPGKYYILAKKKKETNPKMFYNVYHEGASEPAGNIVAGPLFEGDYICYYPNNPVTVTEQNFVNINLPAVTKISLDDISQTNYATPTRIEGIVIDMDGKPMAGIRVFASRHKMLMLMGGKPDFISNVTKEDGRYTINLTEDGVFYLGARDFIGRAPKTNEIFGYYFGTEDHSIVIKKNTVYKNIVIKAWKIE